MKAFCQMDIEELERISLGRVSEEEREAFEEHLLICPACQERYEESESYVNGIRSAAAQLQAESVPSRSWWLWPRLVPVMAGLALLVVGIVTVTRFSAPEQPRLAISLTATRGAAPGETIPVGRAMDLTPDLTGIPVPGPYRLEIVDARGEITWKGDFDPAAKTAHVPPQRAGVHFVRVYSRQGELLREYGLTVR
jgi:hypothetical protein